MSSQGCAARPIGGGVRGDRIIRDSPAKKTVSPEAGVRLKYFGDYELLEEIARGGMGVVWKARQTSLNRTWPSR